MRKHFTFALVILCVLGLTLGCGRQAEQADAGSDSSVGVKYIRQLVAENNRTTRTLMWQSDVRQNYKVEYQEKGTNQLGTQYATECSFTEGRGDYIQYQAQLKGLKPGTVYEYRIVSDKNKGAWHNVKTDGRTGFTALIFPDSQSSDYSGWQKLARSAYQRHSEAELYINMGDLVDNGQDAGQWRAWFASVEPFSSEISFAPVIGNHEAYSIDWQLTPPKSYVNLFQLPQNGLKQYPNQFYSFDYGSVHFTVLDTNFYEAQNWQPNLLEEELAWLEQDLEKSKAKWKIVLQHRDVFMYAFSKDSGRPQRETFFLDFSRRLMPVFEKYQVDAVLSAHLHTYRRRVPLRNFAPAADGITYILTGVAGSVRYPTLWGDFAWDAARAPQPETANYMTLRAEEDKLVFKAYLTDGKEFDSVEITK